VLSGSVRIVVRPENRPPFRVDAVAAEEDTYLVMSEPNAEIRDTDEHPVRIMTRAIEVRPAQPGSVLVKRGHPLRFLAIVHNFDLEPSCREEWVWSSLFGILCESERRRFSSLAMPLIGTVHGPLREARFLFLLRSVLDRVSPCHLKRLWLVAPSGASSDICGMLEALMHE
jgi:hypothetical protein